MTGPLRPTSTFSHSLPFIIRMHLLIRDFCICKKICGPEFCPWDMKDRLKKTSVSVGRHCQRQNILWVHGLPMFVTLLTHQPLATLPASCLRPKAQTFLLLLTFLILVGLLYILLRFLVKTPVHLEFGALYFSINSRFRIFFLNLVTW